MPAGKNDALVTGRGVSILKKLVKLVGCSSLVLVGFQSVVFAQANDFESAGTALTGTLTTNIWGVASIIGGVLVALLSIVLIIKFIRKIIGR